MQNVEKPDSLPYDPKDYPDINVDDLLFDDEDARYNKEGLRQSAVNSHLVRKDENGEVRASAYNKGVLLGPRRKVTRKRQPKGQALEGHPPWKLRKQAQQRAPSYCDVSKHCCAPVSSDAAFVAECSFVCRVMW